MARDVPTRSRLLSSLHLCCRAGLLGMVAYRLGDLPASASGSLPLALWLAAFATYEAVSALLSGLVGD